MHVRIVLAPLGAAMLVTVPAAAKEKPRAPEPEAVSCSGVYGPDSSEALLMETFGAENVVTGPVVGVEGMEYIASTVFPDDLERKMEFAWFDEENRSHLSYVDFSGAQILPGGVRIGMSVAEVEEINGEPFELGGFWWDYGGYGMIASGTLAYAEGGCHLTIRFSPAEELSPDIDITSVAGEVLVSSDNPLLEVIDARVQVLSFGYPWPDDLDPPDY